MFDDLAAVIMELLASAAARLYLENGESVETLLSTSYKT
jgi:hypothetical protein